ncbi:hypothetical protein Heshes_22570 [Alicyclobacillus hesperidum]|uniref:Cell division protein FtsQ n=1 Tax=Alicyclobacillus hesperidum TaxID=89784 RepID=A0A1H2UZ03_9BACL|nr:FtsQ-type POTRA domain-containing protein [Alicyclobacillus hesperidum]GLV14573.1 hypothetical protein Heshes_22570 [Alicyclobacillus hesperidum]SDW61322.1 cell division protein FtsQ [Alicyclobacillus hesperidum]
MPHRPETAEQRDRRKARNRKIVVGFFVFIGLIVALESPLARVRQIAVKGNTTIAQADVVANSGVELGESLWQVNTKQAAARIERRLPMVQSAAVTVDWLHGSVSLSLRERQVVAVYAEAGSFYELLNNGYVFAAEPSSAGLPYPLVSGPDEHVQVHAMMNGDVSTVCRQLAKVPAGELTDVSEFHINGDGTISMYLDNGFVVLADADSLAGAVNAMQSVVHYFVQKGYKPGTVDLTGQPPYRYTPLAPVTNGSQPTSSSQQNAGTGGNGVAGANSAANGLTSQTGGGKP